MTSSPTKKKPVHYLLVPAEIAGQRLDNFLITHLKGVPRTRIYRLVRKGEIRINKGRVKPDYRLKEKDSLRIPPVRFEEKRFQTVEPKNEELLSHILYEDDGFMVINKPAGMAVHGGSGVSFGVIESLRSLRPKLSLELVHRLDKDTSGCLMVAKRRSTLKWLHELLRTGQIEKTYWALVSGKWTGRERIDAPLVKNQLSSGERMVRVDPEGQAAYTEFRILQTFAKVTLMEAKPITGRTHQIRVHATFAGHPIAGDPKYGDNRFNGEMKAVGLNRLFLHAKTLIIPMPDSGPVMIEAPLDNKLSKCLEALSGEQNHV